MLTETEKKQVLGRLKRIEGQVTGIHRMVEEDRYCMEVLQQISAIQGALARVNSELLKNHLNTCVVEAFRSRKAEPRERVISELVDLLAKATRSGTRS